MVFKLYKVGPGKNLFFICGKFTTPFATYIHTCMYMYLTACSVLAFHNKEKDVFAWSECY